MKKLNYFIFVIILVSNLLPSCQNTDIVQDKTILSITENDSKSIVLLAKFSPYKTKKLHEVINTYSIPKVIFKNQNDDVDGNIRLEDGTHFDLAFSEGHLNIKFDKIKNSEESLQKIKRLFGEISETLK